MEVFPYYTLRHLCTVEYRFWVLPDQRADKKILRLMALLCDRL